ncbi:MAG: DNA gyrase C-terminal beta-propeller domain-containing protein, partial [Gemmatimonadales bacterium]
RNVRSTGINAINIGPDDELIDVQVCDDLSDIILATSNGMSIRFHQSDVREMGRAATGVRGIALSAGDRVIDMVVARRKSTLLVVSEKGFGKRSELSDYRVQRRGGKGIIILKKTTKTGHIIALKEVQLEDELMMITRNGVIIRVPVDGIRVIGRNTQGMKVMNLDAGDAVGDVARVVTENGSTVDADKTGAAAGDAS